MTSAEARTRITSMARQQLRREDVAPPSKKDEHWIAIYTKRILCDHEVITYNEGRNAWCSACGGQA